MTDRVASARKPRNVDAPPLPDPCNLCGRPRREHPPKGCPPGAIQAHAFAGAMAASAEREAEEQAEREPAKRAYADKWARIRAEAAAHAPGPFGRFLWLDSQCVRAGLTPTSPWWLWATQEFFATGKPWWYLEVGRGGSKSTTLERLAGSLSMLEEREVPEGQIWEYMFVSVGVDDANRRIRGLTAVNKLGFGLGEGKDCPEELRQNIAYSPRGHIDVHDANGNEIRLSSIAGTIGAVSGPNSIGIIIDEAAKLRDKAANANPLREIIASVIATFRARPNIYAVVCSSAWSTSGAHYEAIHGKDGGDNDATHIARIGRHFLPEALEGLEAVAAWEEIGDVQRPPNPEAARAIRAHARSLTERSPNVPTWVANHMYGTTPAERALRLRMMAQALPPAAVGSLPRHMVWLREYASVPLDVDDGPDYSGQCILAAAITEQLARRFGGAVAKPDPVGLIKVPGARPGDARYAGPQTRAPLGGVSWRKRGML